MEYPTLNMRELAERELDKYFPRYTPFEKVQIKVKKAKGKRLAVEYIEGPALNMEKLVKKEMKKLERKGVFPEYTEPKKTTKLSDEYGEIKGIIVFGKNKGKIQTSYSQKTEDNKLNFYEKSAGKLKKKYSELADFFKDLSSSVYIPSRNSYRNGCSTQLKSIYKL